MFLVIHQMKTNSTVTNSVFILQLILIVFLRVCSSCEQNEHPGVIDAGSLCIGKPRELDKGFHSYWNGFGPNSIGEEGEQLNSQAIRNIRPPLPIIFTHLNKKFQQHKKKKLHKKRKR